MCTENPSIERTLDPVRPLQIAVLAPAPFGHGVGAPPVRGRQGWVLVQL
jgi:hypothetical protein